MAHRRLMVSWLGLLAAACTAAPATAPTGKPWDTALPRITARPTPVPTPTPQPTAPVLTLSSITFTSSVPISDPAVVMFTITNHGSAASQPVWIWFRPTDDAALVDVAYFEPAGANHYGRIGDILSPEYAANAIVLPSIAAAKAVKCKLGLMINDLGQPVTLAFAIGEGPVPVGSMDVDAAYNGLRPFGGFEATIDAHF